MPIYRNPCATNPLLRKGGAHTQSKTGRRSRDHYDLLDEAAQCMEAYIRQRQTDNEAEGHSEKEKGEHDAPLSFCPYKKMLNNGFFTNYFLAGSP